MQKKNEIFDEKIFSLLEKIQVPKNPFSFYLNIAKIEKNLSEWLRDYFYKAIWEFLHHSSHSNYDIEKIDNSQHFLMKIYYYTWFIDKMAIWIGNFLKDMKYYDIVFYLDCVKEFDEELKLKIAKLLVKMKNRTNEAKIDEIINHEDIVVFEIFEKEFLNLDPIKDKETIDAIYKSIDIDLMKYSISYKTTNKDYQSFIKEKTINARYYRWISLCMDKIVSKYNKEQENCQWFIWNLLAERSMRRQYCEILDIINSKERNFKNLNLIKKLEKNKKIFKYKHEFDRFLLSELINQKHQDLKNLFYWEASKKRLSEDEWADMGGANLFYLQKIDKNIWNFQLLMFFKQFKDTLIQLYNSIFWPFIKPYFFYILVFKSVKLPLKDRYKMFFLLMFFSAESYNEYFILQKIMKSIEKIWLWKSYTWVQKLIFYIQRFTTLISEFFSSIALIWFLILALWWFGIINFLMLIIIFSILALSCIKYLIFPWRIEIFRVFVFLSIWILGYVWFTRVFPKISQPQYISYIWRSVDSLISLDFSKTKEDRKNMINFIYWKNYKELEYKLIANIKEKSKNISESEKIKNIIESTKKYTTDILAKDKYIKVQKWRYLKYYVNKEVDKLDMKLSEKKALAEKTTKDYIEWYCFTNKDHTCRSKLEKLPVGFWINTDKIKSLIEENLSK